MNLYFGPFKNKEKSSVYSYYPDTTQIQIM